MRMLRAFYCVVIVSSLVGCRQTLLVAAPQSVAPAYARQVTWSNHFFYGFVGRRQVDLRDHCQDGTVERVELSSTAATVALTIATLGIYCPRRVTVTCARTIAP